MPIAITYPSNGTPQRPRRLPRVFAVLGTKDPSTNEIPLGVMLSVNRAGDVDHKYRVGGQTFFRENNPASRQWGMVFRMPAGIPRAKRFKLAVINSHELPARIAAQNPVSDLREHLIIRRSGRTGRGPVVGPAVAGGVRAGVEMALIGGPEPSSQSPRAVVAWGELPGQEEELDYALDNTSATKLVDLADDTVVGWPESVWVDSGFWVVYFNEVPTTAPNPNRVVDMYIKYKTYGTEEVSEDIELEN